MLWERERRVRVRRKKGGIQDTTSKQKGNENGKTKQGHRKIQKVTLNIKNTLGTKKGLVALN